MKRYLTIFLCFLMLAGLLSCTTEPVETSGDPSSKPSEQVSGDASSPDSVPSGETSPEPSVDSSESAQESPAGTDSSDTSPEDQSRDPQNSGDESPADSQPAEETSGSSSQPVSAEPSDDVSEPVSQEQSDTDPDPVSDEKSDPVSDDTSDEISDDTSDEPSEPDETSDSQLIPVHVNLIQGLKYTVDTEGYRADVFGDFEDTNGKKCRYRLTDGVTTDGGSSHAICGYNDGTVSFFFDLGEEKVLEDWETDLWGGTWGIGVPDECTVSIYWSVDGIKYNLADQGSPDKKSVQTVGDFKKGVIRRTFSKTIKARYLRADYSCGTFVWTSELKINGTQMEEGGDIPRVNITTENNDRVHRSEYHTCTLEIIDPSKKHETILDAEGLIKIRGNSTSSGAKQPFNIKFSSKQDVLGMGACKKWYLLANMYDKTQIRNKLSYDFADDIGMAYVQQSTFVRVYLNGEYRGIYQLCESIGTGKTRVDINPNGNEFLLEYEPWEQYANDNWIRTTNFNILLGFNEPDVPTEAQRAWLKDFFRKAESAISSKKIAEIEKYLDVDSFIDAYIVEEYFKEVDYSTSSTRFYIKNGKWYAGPVWDFDLSSGNCSSTYYKAYNNVDGSGNSWEGYCCMGLWNSRLFQTPEIKERLAKRYQELQPIIINLYQDNELGKCKIDALLDQFRDEIDLNYTVWSTSVVYSDLERVPTDGTYDSEITYLKNWLKNRNAWMLSALGLK